MGEHNSEKAEVGGSPWRKAKVEQSQNRTLTQNTHTHTHRSGILKEIELKRYCRERERVVGDGGENDENGLWKRRRVAFRKRSCFCVF